MNGCIAMDDGRRAVDFGELELEQISGCENILNHIIEVVSHERKGQTKQVHETRPWLYWDKRTNFFKNARKLPRIIACVKTSQYICFDFANPNHFFSQSLKLFADDRAGLLAILQSTANEYWIEVTTSTMGTAVRYNTSTSFDTFPFPGPVAMDQLSDMGEVYYQIRNKAKEEIGCGLTSLYTQMHSPFSQSRAIDDLRNEHEAVNRAVMHAFGWDDIILEHGFCLDREHAISQSEQDPKIMEYLRNPEVLFAKSEAEVNAIETDIMRLGMNRKNLIWRFGWPSPTREKVLSRLLALNAERYANEVAQGLHAKGGKKPAANNAAAGKRRGGLLKLPTRLILSK